MRKPNTIVCSLVLMLLSLSATASPRQEVIAGPLMGEVLSVFDGDTLQIRLHVWIGQHIETSLRIAGIDTPEMKGKCDQERALAKAARAELEALVKTGHVKVSDIQLEKYAGRVLARAETTDGIDIAAHLIQKGLARPYHGKKRAGWCGA